MPVRDEGRIVLVGGAGIELDEWRIGLGGKERRVALASEQRFSTQDEASAFRIDLPAPGELFDLPFTFRDGYDVVTSELSLGCRVLERDGVPLVRLSLPGSDEALAELAEGEWSRRLILPFDVDGSQVDGAFRVKVLTLDPAAGLLRLYVTDICRLSWLEHPQGAIGGHLALLGPAHARGRLGFPRPRAHRCRDVRRAGRHGHGLAGRCLLCSHRATPL